MIPKGTRSVPETAVNDVIAGRYRIEREVGRGGMATVYLCTDLKTSTLVALKVLRSELGSAVVVERFLREIEFASQLDHPRIPKVLDSGVLGELPYYVMTFVEGESLRSRLDHAKQLPIDEAIRITQAVIDPMAYAHARGIVHRDIKPANILLGGKDVYVLDFGIARAILVSSDESLTSTGAVVGTPAYMSPEQALSDRDLDTRSDIYSLACVTYEMIAGIPPFVGATPQAVMARRFVASPPPLRETRESVPEAIEKAVAKALARAPADRWQRVEEFGTALTLQSPSMQSEQARLPIRRKNIAIALAVTILLAVLATAAFSYASFNRDYVVRGQAALSGWKISAAEALFRKRLAQKPGDPKGELWLAQALMLDGAPKPDLRPHLLRALDGRKALDAGENARLDALLAFVSERDDNPCPLFEKLASITGGSTNDNSAKLALADCLTADQSIVPDPRSATHYGFRSSWNHAASIYEALLLRNADDAAAYRAFIPRLGQVLPTESDRFRVGALESEPPRTFVALPALLGDTLSFVPYPLEAGVAIRSHDPSGLQRAIDRNLSSLRQHTLKWVEIDPNDAAAHESLAGFLESTGELSLGAHSAIRHIALARRIASLGGGQDTAEILRRLRLASIDVRLSLKSRQFARAATLADSVLSWQLPQLDDSSQRSADDVLGGLAALRGQIARLIKIDQRYAADYFVRLPSGEARKLPSELGAEASRLSDYAAFGVPVDSITALAERISLKLEALIPASDLPAVRAALLTRPLSLAAPFIGAAPVAALGGTPDLFVSAMRALASGKKKQARAFADSLVRLHSEHAPGEVTMDVVFQDHWLQAVLGDTVAAETGLENALRGLSKMPSTTIEDEVMAAGLVRVMILRAELARATGNTKAARDWAGVAAQLWGKGDEPTRSVVNGLQLEVERKR